MKQIFEHKNPVLRGKGFRVPVAVAAFLGLGIAGWAGQGYLKAVGPAPLRYLPPTPPLEKVTKRIVASLPKNESVPTAVEDTNLLTGSNFPDATVTSVKSPAGAAQTNLIMGTAPDEGTVSPQMLIKYFSKSTNGTGTGVIAPMNFAPSPQPAPSSASYTNTP